MNSSYKDLYTQVVEEIEKRRTYPSTDSYDSSLSKSQITDPLSFTAKNLSVDVGAVTDAVYAVLAEMIAPTIISGLTVEATDPISNKVKVKAGKGTIGGRIYTLNQDVTIEVPFDIDNTTTVFYINFHINGVKIERTQNKDLLMLAKVIVPNPGTTNRVKDSRNDYDIWDAHIVSYKPVHFYGDGKGNLEEDSIDLLRDNIGDILADNIIGNIRLSEDLKIINTAGTLELNSNSLKLKDSSGNLLSKFNDKGVYFYDTNAVELARFTSIDARIGNIIIGTDSISSGNFSSGALGSGFKIEDSGHAEFQDVYIRGKLTSTVFEYETISTIGGNLLVLDGDVLDSDMTALDASTLVISGDTNFSVGDILRMKDGIDDEWVEVTGINGNIYTITRDKNSDYGADSNPIWKKGMAVVNYKQSGDGGIFMTSSESNAPFINIFKHTGSPWSSIDTVTRFGNLNGFLGYSTDLYGIAIGEAEKYLKYDPTNGLRIKGDITITGGNASITYYQATEPGSSGDSSTPKDGDFWVDTDDGNKTYVYDSGSWNLTSSLGITDSNGKITTAATPSGEGLYLGSSYMGYYSGSAWQTYIQSNGNFLFQGDGSNYVQWDGADLTVRGTLNADDINVGTLSGITIQGNTIQTAASGSRVVMNSEAFIAYDDSSGGGLEVFKIILSNPDSGQFEGDVTIGDYYNGRGIRWNASADTFHIKGDITASSGTFTGTINVGTAGRVYIDGPNEVIKVYDASSNLMVELGRL